MNASELKSILLSIVQKIDDLLVNQDALGAMTKPGHSLGDRLDAKRIAVQKTKNELSALRKQIEELA